MKKAILILLAASAAQTAAFAADDITVLVDGTAVEFTETAPFIEDGRTLVPMRAIFEALGASVQWDGDTKTIVSFDPASDTSIILQIDNNKMLVGDRSVELDVPAKIVNDRTVVPVRAIAEGMSCAVDWDAASRTVTVSRGSTSLANPWKDYDSLEALNDDMEYAFPEIVTDGLVSESFRQLKVQQLSEAGYTYPDGAKVTVRLKKHSEPVQDNSEYTLEALGIEDISGIYGAVKIADLERQEEFAAQPVEVYSAQYPEGDVTTIYALTYFLDNDGCVYDCAVTAESNALSQDEMITLIKRVISDIHLTSDSYTKEYGATDGPKIKNGKLAQRSFTMIDDMAQTDYSYADDTSADITLYAAKEGFAVRTYTEPGGTVSVGGTEIEVQKGYDEWKEKNVMYAVFEHGGMSYGIRVSSAKLADDEMKSIIKSVAGEILK